MSLINIENDLLFVNRAEISPFNELAVVTAEVEERVCTPFFVSVMVFSPEAGYKFFIKVQKSCSQKNLPIWKLRFELDKLIDGSFVKLVTVEVGANTDGEQEEVKKVVKEGMTFAQVKAMNQNVYPQAKIIGELDRDPTIEEGKQIRAAMKNALKAQ